MLKDQEGGVLGDGEPDFKGFMFGLRHDSADNRPNVNDLLKIFGR